MLSTVWSFLMSLLCLSLPDDVVVETEELGLKLERELPLPENAEDEARLEALPETLA
jgi:hypothetical protein